MIDTGEVLAGLAFLERYAPKHLQAPITVARLDCEKVLRGERYERMLDAPVNSLELSIRALNSLDSMGVKTVRQAREQLPAIGAKSGHKKIAKELRELFANMFEDAT